MQARGVLKELIQPGATVTVMGFPHKTKTTEMKAEQIRIGDKTTNIR
jgi:deoxyribose-phosphate aldolase